MKRTITITTQKEIEIQTPVYRKSGTSFYRVNEDGVIKVDTLCFEIQLFGKTLSSPWSSHSEDATELEFYTAYAATRNALDIAANVESLQLDQRYMDMVAEECRHDNEPDHEEREHMEEMDYRASQMGSI